MAPRGMTLIEVMATLAVLTVMTALSMVGFGGAIDRRREGAAIASVAQVTHEARGVARKYRQPVRVMITTVGTRQTVRWERLACEDTWGSVCPSGACATSACGSGGCVCPEVGETVQVPKGLTLAASFQGLCFAAGSGAPRLVSGGRYCDDAASAPASNALTFTVAGAVAEVLELEPLTGNGRLVDCKSATRDPALCP